MSSIPSPILLLGDSYLCNDHIVDAKRKYSEAQWVTVDASEQTLNSIRMEAGMKDWNGADKILLIKNIPNRKQARDFLIDLGKTAPDHSKIIIWDSSNQIKVDPKTKTFNKTWGNFVKSFKKIDGSKIVNNGEKLTEKESSDSVEFVRRIFNAHDIAIDSSEAKLVVNIVGYDRGMLKSDIIKMSATAPSPITSEFIMENAFPSSKEALLYKLNNVLHTASYENTIVAMESFLNSGFHPNELAVILLKASRWQLLATSYWVKGMAWSDIPSSLMKMGKFPSMNWHNPNKSDGDKKKEADKYKEFDDKVKYMRFKMGLPEYLFTKTTKKPRPEVLPHPFVAKGIVEYVQNKVVRSNSREGISTDEFKKRILSRASDVYLFINGKMNEIRYGEDPIQDLHEMVRVLTTVRVN